MAPTLAIPTLALVLLLWSPSAAATRRRRVGSGGSSYCVDDNNQQVLCGNTIASIVGGAISGLCSLNHLCAGTAHFYFLTHSFLPVFLVILYFVGMALWRRRRWRRKVLLPKIAAMEAHPETSTIASGSSFHNTADTTAEPPPAYMKYPHPEQPHQPNVVPVGTYAAPQDPPPV